MDKMALTAIIFIFLLAAIRVSSQEDGHKEDGPQEGGHQEGGPQEGGYEEDEPQEDGLQEDGLQEDGDQEDAEECLNFDYDDAIKGTDEPMSQRMKGRLACMNCCVGYAESDITTGPGKIRCMCKQPFSGKAN